MSTLTKIISTAVLTKNIYIVADYLWIIIFYNIDYDAVAFVYMMAKYEMGRHQIIRQSGERLYGNGSTEHLDQFKGYTILSILTVWLYSLFYSILLEIISNTYDKNSIHRRV